MKNQLIENISLMIPEGNRLKLPATIYFNNYAEVKKALLTAGGKYKKGGYFEFTEDAGEVQARLVGGEVINDKKKFQFFATPEHLARRLVDLVEPISADMTILEPSAGQGAIVEVLESRGVKNLTLVELMPENCKVLLRKGYGEKLIKGDFLAQVFEAPFDIIVANPPFSKNQDVDHVLKMYEVLKPGGTLVSIMSKSWTFGSQKKQISFRNFLDEVEAETYDVDAGEFKASGTNVSAVIVKIRK